MKNTPPEIEALIWSIAESGDPQAVSEFENRFPQHRLELLKRMNAVQELRKAKGSAPLPMSYFRPTPQSAPIQKFGRIGVTACALVGVAIASYWASSKLLTPKPLSTPPGTSQSGAQNQPALASREPFGESASEVRPKKAVAEDESHLGMAPANPSPITPSRMPTRAEKPITIHVERANLQTLLDGLAQQAGWTLELAPGTPNPEVRVDYDDVSPTDILKDMGKRFGFTAFDEGSNHILVIPARDGSGPYNIEGKGPDGVEADPKRGP